MSLLRTALVAGGVMLGLAAISIAQETQPWDLKERNAYVVDMQGKMRIYQVGEKGAETIMKHARKVEPGTVYFMNKGELHQAQGPGVMFDKAGNWMLSNQ